MDHFPPLNQVGGVFTRQEQPHINSHMAIDPRRSSSDISMGSLRRDSLNIIRDDEDNVSTLSTASETTHVGQTTTNNPTRHSNPSQIPAYQPVHNDMTGTGPDETVPLASIHREAKSFTKTKEPKKSPVSWWWWWEIGAAFLSLVCVGLILAVLLKANNLALADWPLWIQPNSLLAVFTTVGKSALMVPVASCISQLKWRHFQVRANRLSHLQILDDASRGPWGSLMVLLNVRVRAFTVWALAIVSLIALGFDPSAQQILDFPVRDTRLTNISAEIGTAVEYSSIAYLEDKDGSSGQFDFATLPNPGLFKLQSSIIDGISGSVFQPMYTCPGDHCSWPDFTTLGVCSNYQNLTDSIKINCTGKTTVVLNCTYTFPSDLPLQYSQVEPFVMSFAQQGEQTAKPTTLFQSQGWIGEVPVSDGTMSSGAFLYTVKVMDNDMGSDLTQPPGTETYYSAWYWCTKTYRNLTATAEAIDPGPVTYERLQANGSSDSLNGYYTYLSPSKGTAYNIAGNADAQLFGYIAKLLTRQIVDQYPHAGSTFDADSLDLSSFLYTSDVEAATEDLAATLTNQVRSLNPGDNTNASSFHGAVYVKETYIRVTWPWLVLPLAETLLVALLLIISIFLTFDQRLLKTSLIALLVHGLEGWTSEELAVPQPENAEKLDKLSEAMLARLVVYDDGRLQFVRV